MAFVTPLSWKVVGGPLRHVSTCALETKKQPDAQDSGWSKKEIKSTKLAGTEHGTETDGVLIEKSPTEEQMRPKKRDNDRLRSQPRRMRPELMADEKSSFVRVGTPGLRVHYKEDIYDKTLPVKEEDRLDGLMLHGLLGSTFTYRKIQPLLAQSLQGRAISIDMPGFGLTERPNMMMYRMSGGKTPYSKENTAELTRELIGALDLKNTILFGHSLGGAVALEAALQGADIKGLVLFSPAIRIQSMPRFVKLAVNSVLSAPIVGDMAVRMSMENAVSGERVHDMLKRNFHDLSRISLEETIAGYMQPMQAYDWDSALRHFSMSFDGFDMFKDSRLKDLKVPTLIIMGEHDKILPVAEMEEFSRHVHNCTIRTVYNCGHIPQEELPERTYAIIRNWVNYRVRRTHERRQTLPPAL